MTKPTILVVGECLPLYEGHYHGSGGAPLCGDGHQKGGSQCVLLHLPACDFTGNEGSGLRTNIKRACSGFVKVEMGLPRQQLAADSLNVSVAAGILMHSLVGSADTEAAVVGPARSSS